MAQLPTTADWDDVLAHIQQSVLHHSTRGGSIRIVIQSDEGEEVQVLKIDAHCTLLLPTNEHHLSQHQQRSLLLHSEEQQRRIKDLEARLQQALEEIHECAQRTSVESAPVVSIQCAPETTESPSSGREAQGDAINDDDTSSTTESTSQSLSCVSTPSIEASLSPSAEESTGSSLKRRSSRSKKEVDRWTCVTDAAQTSLQHTSFRKKRKIRHHRHHGGEYSNMATRISTEQAHLGVDSSDGLEDDEVDAAALMTKFRESHDKRQSLTIDSLCQESILTLRQQVLNEEGHNTPTISAQITALITTSMSLKMVGYYLRAILAHRLKRTSQGYKRLAREKLGVKSSADIAAYPALYELVQHHYPTLATSGIETWLTNPIFMADISWTEWKRYLTKQGRPIIDAALHQFQASIAPFRDWMQLGWVEVYNDENLCSQGVRAVRDIHLPSKHHRGRTNRARDISASISVIAADLQCAGLESLVRSQDEDEMADPTYLMRLSNRRLFSLRLHWIGKINHLPISCSNLSLTAAGKLEQIKEIRAGDALTYDYGIEYWVRRVTGLNLSEWTLVHDPVCRHGRLALFTRMHEMVLDYSGILCQPWSGSLRLTSTAVQREQVLIDLEDYLDLSPTASHPL